MTEITHEERQAMRERHVHLDEAGDHCAHCCACGPYDEDETPPQCWPCDATRLLDAYEALEEEVISLKHLAALHAADANAAREEVQRLRGLLAEMHDGGHLSPDPENCMACYALEEPMSAAPQQPEAGEGE